MKGALAGTWLRLEASGLLRSGTISAANQIVSSGTNFALSVYLANILNAEQFGLYGIAFSISLLYTGVATALITTQMVINLPDIDAERRTEFSGRMLGILIGFNGLATLLVICLAMTDAPTRVGIPAAIYTATALLCASSVIKDFFVRLAYSQQQESAALAMNVCSGLLIGALFLRFHFTDSSIDGVGGLNILSIGQGFAAVVGVIWTAPSFRAVTKPLFVHDIKRAWIGGKWALSGGFVIWGQSQAYVYILAVLLGPAGVGYANAARLLISPFQFIVPAIGQIMLPRLASMRSENPSGLIRLARRYRLFMVTLAAIYLVALAILYSWVEHLLLGGRYQNLQFVVAAWGLLLIIQLTRDSGSIAMQALGKFKAIFQYNVISCVIVLGASWMLATWLGAAGAVLGVAVGEGLLAYFVWRELSVKIPAIRVNG